MGLGCDLLYKECRHVHPSPQIQQVQTGIRTGDSAVDKRGRARPG